MPALAIPVLVGLGLFLMTGKKKLPGGIPDKIPPGKKEAYAALSEYRDTPQGKARYWIAAVAPTAQLKLANLAVAKVYDDVFEGARVLVYRVIQGNIVEGTLSANDIATLAFQAGAASIVSLGLWDNIADTFLVCCPNSQRALWTANNPTLAVLYDGIGGETPTPKAPDDKKPGQPGGGSVPWAKTPPKDYKGGDSPEPYSDQVWPYDLNMSLEERKGAMVLMMSKTATKSGLESAAYAADNCGAGHGAHPKLATAFRLKASKLSGDSPAVVSFPYTIKADGSDWPYSLAKSYTGDGNRWKEILPLNPNLKVGTQGGGTPAYDKDGKQPGEGWDTPQGDEPDGKDLDTSWFNTRTMSGSTPGDGGGGGGGTAVTTVTPWNAGQVIQLPISWGK